MGRHKVYNRKLVTLNLDVVLMEEMKNLYSNISEKINELIENHLTGMKHDLDNIDYATQQVRKQMEQLEEELKELQSEKQILVERKSLQEKQVVVPKKKLSPRMTRIKSFMSEMGFEGKEWQELSSDARTKILAKVHRSDKK